MKKVLTFASAKRGNAPFAEGPLLCPRKVKRSLKDLHRQNEVVQEAMAAILRQPLGRRNEPSIDIFDKTCFSVFFFLLDTFKDRLS